MTPSSDRVPRRALLLAALAVGGGLAAAVLRATSGPGVPTFVAAALSLAGLAGLVGEATDALGERLGPGATGVLQSALGNLPELFIGFFALRAGLVAVVTAALIGSILANALLVLGLAFIAGGLRHGRQRFGAGATRRMVVLLMLAVGSLAVPTLAALPGAPAAGHAESLSIVVSVVLLAVFVVSIPSSLSPAEQAETPSRHRAGLTEPVPRQRSAALAGLGLPLLVLTLAALGAAVVSDWFVEALQPAMAALGMSEAFAGLVVVAIAGNAVENVVGIQAALRDDMDLAISLILNSALQVALALTPALVFVGFVVGAQLTLVLSPLLLGAVALTAILATVIVVDGESTALEGLALVGLYVIVAASVWWGPAMGA
ncbi:MAG TPA: calcium/proton exchanger [Candidatus Limnocylindrales bacterium]